MKVEGYVDICACCFEPIKEGNEFKFSDEGRTFHKLCVQSNPDSYYVALERIKAEFNNGGKPTNLMNEIERIFNIPMLNDEAFNQENEEVMELYREISNSRWL